MLKHVISHTVVQSVLETFVLKVELYIVVFILLDNVEENFNGSLGDRLLVGWLRELYFILQDVSEFLSKEHLVSENF